MEVKITKNDNVTTAKLIGRLDTPASLEVGKELEPLEKVADGTIVLDCTELSYISSSGLRIFLTLRKAAMVKGGNVIVRGINDEIRNVFMMTGFLNLFQIED
ncbi:MAG: STAS domain-containing protein [Bacteroidales bacterium]|nr:STAS domain-containing protein [Bacteroidales bacterium]